MGPWDVGLSRLGATVSKGHEQTRLGRGPAHVSESQEGAPPPRVSHCSRPRPGPVQTHGCQRGGGEQVSASASPRLAAVQSIPENAHAVPACGLGVPGRPGIVLWPTGSVQLELWRGRWARMCAPNHTHVWPLSRHRGVAVGTDSTWHPGEAVPLPCCGEIGLRVPDGWSWLHGAGGAGRDNT